MTLLLGCGQRQLHSTRGTNPVVASSTGPNKLVTTPSSSGPTHDAIPGRTSGDKVNLLEGGDAYVRMRTEHDTNLGGTFAFGDRVRLVERVDDPGGVPSWIVVVGTKKSKLPVYALTSSTAEIDYLRSHNRIPKTITYVYTLAAHQAEIDALRSQDRISKSIAPVYAGDDSHIVATAGFVEYKTDAETHSTYENVAVKENAILFEPKVIYPGTSHLAASWGVFDKEGRALPIRKDTLYYCVASGDSPRFEAIDLRTLAATK